MLRLSKRTDYGLIALKHLAEHGDQGSLSAKEIAEYYQIPLPLLSKILQQLTRAGFLKSEHGTRGGYRLARDPQKISALEVIRSIDGPVMLTSCHTGHGGCSQAASCTVKGPLRRLHEGMLSLLANISITDMDEEGASETLNGRHWEKGSGGISPRRPTAPVLTEP